MNHTTIFVEPRGKDWEARYWHNDEQRYFYRVSYDKQIAIQQLRRDHQLQNTRVVYP